MIGPTTRKARNSFMFFGVMAVEQVQRELADFYDILLIALGEIARSSEMGCEDSSLWRVGIRAQPCLMCCVSYDLAIFCVLVAYVMCFLMLSPMTERDTGIFVIGRKQL